MAARQDDKSLEKSSSISEQASRNPRSSVSIDVALDTTTSSEGCDFIESSPAVLEPSKDESRSQVPERRRNLSKKNSRPMPLNAEAASVVDGSQRNVCDDQQHMAAGDERNDNAIEQEVEQQTDAQVEIPRTDCFEAFYNCYNEFVFMFRNSSFIYLLQILFSSIPLSAVVVGFAFLDKCPKAIYLPGLGAGIGIIGLIYMGLWMSISRLNRQGIVCSPKKKFAFLGFSVLLTLALITDAVLVYCLAPSFNPASKDYCNETFYTYSYYKEVATVVVVVFSALLYFPGMCHALFCYRCALVNSGQYYAI